jgi:hypothetical protein
MSAAASAPVPTPQPSRSGRLLDLVRGLIDYGKQLVSTLRQRPDIGLDAFRFGTNDLALILARITCGLHRANALEARLLRRAARLDREPAPSSAPSGPRQCAARRPSRRANSPDAGLPRLPTPEQIAAEVRRRPIGTVIADICRDLGITPSHPLWREVQHAIIRYGGSLATLVRDILDRAFPIRTSAPATSPVSALQVPIPASTGPP